MKVSCGFGEGIDAVDNRLQEGKGLEMEKKS